MRKSVGAHKPHPAPEQLSELLILWLRRVICLFTAQIHSREEKNKVGFETSNSGVHIWMWRIDLKTVQILLIQQGQIAWPLLYFQLAGSRTDVSVNQLMVICKETKKKHPHTLLHDPQPVVEFLVCWVYFGRLYQMQSHTQIDTSIQWNRFGKHSIKKKNP